MNQLRNVGRGQTKRLMNNNKELQRKMKNLEETVKQLNEKVEALEKKHSKDVLILGQMPYTVEEIIIDEVLGKFCGEDIPIYKIEQMETALDSPVDGVLFATKEDQTAAKAEWESLKKSLGWNKYDAYSLQNLKRYRHDDAHPRRPPEDVKRSLDKLIKLKKNDHDFQKDVKKFEKFLKMYEALYKFQTSTYQAEQ